MSALESNGQAVFTELANAKVSYNDFELIYVYKMDEIHELPTNIENSLGNLEEMSRVSPTAAAAFRQIRHMINLARREEISLNVHSRKKRFILCEMCGRPYYWMFGIMDQKEGKEVHRRIDNVMNVLEKEHAIQLNQTRIVADSLKINECLVEELSQQLNDTMKNIGFAMTETNKQVAAQGAIQVITLLLIEHERALARVKQSFSLKAGEMPEIISEEKLKKDLMKIEENLPPNKALPMDMGREDTLHIFKYTMIRASKRNNKIIMKLTIPIVKRDEFVLYKLTPVPLKLHKSTLIVKPVTSYFLLDKQERMFNEMSSDQIENGIRIDDTEVIYKPTKITQLIPDNSCEWQLFRKQDLETYTKVCEMGQIKNGNYMVAVNKNDVYYLSIRDPWEFTKRCDHQRHERIMWTDDGLITLQADCDYATDEFIVHGHSTYKLNESQLISSHISAFALKELEMILSPTYVTVNLTGPKLIDNMEQLHRLTQEAESLSKAANFDLKLEKMAKENKETSLIFDIFSGTSILIIALIIIFIYFYCKKDGSTTKIDVNFDMPRTAYPRTPMSSKRGNNNNNCE